MPIHCPECLTLTSLSDGWFSCPTCESRFRPRNDRLEKMYFGIMPDPPWAQDVCLVTGFPRSGTTIAAHLVAKATDRIATGPWGVLLDHSARSPGPIGVVHEHKMTARKPDRVILVQRHWVECTMSHWYRDIQYTRKRKTWRDWVEECARWEGSTGLGTSLALYRAHEGPKAVIRYDELMADPRKSILGACKEAGMGPKDQDYRELSREFSGSYPRLGRDWTVGIPDKEYQDARNSIRGGLGDDVLAFYEGGPP